jgi:nitrate/nitrite transporter NarK
MSLATRHKTLVRVLSSDTRHGAERMEHLRHHENIAYVRAGALLAFNALLIACTIGILGIDGIHGVLDQPLLGVKLNLGLCLGSVVVCLAASTLAISAIIARGHYDDVEEVHVEVLLDRYVALLEQKDTIIHWTSYLSVLGGLVFLLFLLAAVFDGPPGPSPTAATVAPSLCWTAMAGSGYDRRRA